jgi:hypothetical protein
MSDAPDLRTAAQALLDAIGVYASCRVCGGWVPAEPHKDGCPVATLAAALAAEATEPPEYRPGDVGAVMELGKRISDHLAAGSPPPTPTPEVER